MGLDMYAFATAEKIVSQVNFEVNESEEIHYWRKHPDLNGWMEALYREKGGYAEFNCVNVQLSEEDLERLERDVTAAELPFTQGLFFGTSNGSEVDDDLAFIVKARKAISAGKSVLYTSWW